VKLISLNKNYKSLIQKAARNNRRAQHQLFELFAPRMLSVCRQYMNNKEEAEEVMLNGFMKVFTKLNHFSGQGSFEGWIRRIMVNESLSELRKRKQLDFTDQAVIDNSLLHAEQPVSDIAVEEIQRLIDALPGGYKAVFVLYAVEGYKHGEIAELLEISEGTSKSQLSKARAMLQHMINKQNKQHYGTR
jgi:RNA polymerase sigma-70 factor (ECF subfamily)